MKMTKTKLCSIIGIKNNIETNYRNNDDKSDIFLKAARCILSLLPPRLVDDPDSGNIISIAEFNIMQSSLSADFTAVNAAF